MKIDGEINVEKKNVRFYHGLAALVDNQIKKKESKLIPSFIIEEAINYFCELEKYEVCQKIKMFFVANPTFVQKATRAEWYGNNKNNRVNKK